MSALFVLFVLFVDRFNYALKIYPRITRKVLKPIQGEAMRMRFHVLSSLLLFTLFFGFAGGRVHSQQDVTIVEGEPPLTQSMVARTLILLEWSLDIRLSDEQRAQIARSIIGYWKTNNRTEISNT